ncbi:MAG TPA: hypothetical protein QGF04_00055 [Woeseiaceae bacterium]|jgi:hypothetical protein|nr:hypothetical protein [Woeseiaceae bacterium]
MHRLLIIIFCSLFNNVSFAEDPATGLIIAPGWELVRTHCGACHSYQLVTTQRADKEGWRDMIKWMQETQNLWELDTNTEEGILDYLSKSYPPKEGRRRAPIIKSLMPVTR